LVDSYAYVRTSHKRFERPRATRIASGLSYLLCRVLLLAHRLAKLAFSHLLVVLFVDGTNANTTLLPRTCELRSMRTPRLCAAQIKRKNPSKKMAHEETHSTMEQDVPTNKKAGHRRSKHHHSKKSGHHDHSRSCHHQSKHHQEKDVIKESVDDGPNFSPDHTDPQVTKRRTPKGHHDKTTSRTKAPGRYGEDDDGEVPPPRMPQYYYDEEALRRVSNIGKVERSPAVPKQEEMYNTPYDWQPSKASHDEKRDWKQSDVDAKPAPNFAGKSSRIEKGPDLAPWPNANQTRRTMSHPANTK
jgi:hypothetical protein